MSIVLIEIADNYNDIYDHGTRLLRDKLTLCTGNDEEKISQMMAEANLVQVWDGNHEAIYAIIDYNLCVADAIQAHNLPHMTADEFANIEFANPDWISAVEIQSDSAGCSIM